ncbi:MAG: hypothetical protein RSB82_01650 [Victivallaceae bacterium]
MSIDQVIQNTNSVQLDSLQQKKSSESLRNLTKSTGLLALAVIFLILAIGLCMAAFLPVSVLPFSGAYFIVGSFLAFVSITVLLIALIYLIKDLKNQIHSSSQS